ncbi:hypothetical protein HMPREF1990_01734 [Porphyromonas gingivalis W4087]|uniref:Uncharacterized protein n=1 Tax=Porphyromonas gingivalis F0570 TaxID=1227271 RepID=A0A0E2LPF8_PORGN|nr:hypothetical protein A343_1378 [Porphyromonas gingivalis JCVI SC001]ERJ64616.1 hypothetical protein HMPREF1555_01759 [Porphyromonas gingivalis F0570]ERJ67571.1 hypothetical protein HMPREF1554_00959 [Porphyromonas gingivalis F0569]ERJ68270.1 hypothetical protein HMPREF1553_01110 [Porphyromonas gingivalis F0568]ERJ83502.1 hypothetical protein HMPREF1988_01160 [Porphyromonas gingivalis F0185]ERJ87623.1 hypothetical protein HMPREF1990_01734 [Porphyromonas gingivalis W4087]
MTATLPQLSNGGVLFFVLSTPPGLFLPLRPNASVSSGQM